MDNLQLQLDTPGQLAFERSFYIGSYVTAILFGQWFSIRRAIFASCLTSSLGMQLFMFFLSNYFLLCSSTDTRKESFFYIFYSSVMLILWTVASSCNAAFGQKIWIDFRDVPGGPAAYLYDNLSAWYNTLGTVTGICMNFLADGLLVKIYLFKKPPNSKYNQLYRAYVIWGSSIKIVALPIVLYFGAMCMYSHDASATKFNQTQRWRFSSYTRVPFPEQAFSRATLFPLAFLISG
jgi:hypothetical protein